MTSAELKSARIALGWSQARLAGALGCSVSAIAKWEAEPHARNRRAIPGAVEVLVNHWLLHPECRP